MKKQYKFNNYGNYCLSVYSHMKGIKFDIINDKLYFNKNGNSSAFRMDAAVPLVIPEINPDDVKLHKGIIANPNCTTAITLMALFPLHQAFNVTRIFASSYQAVSGTGAKAIEEFERQVGQIVAGKPVTKEVYPHQIAFNVLPHVDSFLPTGYTKEEMKMQNEGRKIMHHATFRASVTCVRVPVYPRALRRRQRRVRETRHGRTRPRGAGPGAGPGCGGRTGEKEYPLPLYAAEKYNCQVAAFAWIARWKTGFVSGSPATSCSKARPSTRSRLPKNW